MAGHSDRVHHTALASFEGPSRTEAWDFGEQMMLLKKMLRLQLQRRGRA